MVPSDKQLAACKRYMRVDNAEDDSVISDLYISNLEYLAGAGIFRTADNAGRFDLVVNRMTLYYYDHRDASVSEACLPGDLRPWINQLKMESEVQAAAEKVREMYERDCY